MSPQLTPPPARRRGRRLTLLLLTALLVVPTVEIALIIAIGRTIGGWPTLGLLLVESALGAWLVRREGARAWQALSQALRFGAPGAHDESSRGMPATELSDAALVLVGGTLLLTPGFLTDVVGFCFVLPFTRPFARRLLAGLIARRLVTGLGPFARRGPVVRGTVIPGVVIDPPGDDGAGRTG